MHITLFNFFHKPNPQYQNMAAGLRTLGHTVWLGARHENGSLRWHDGRQVVGIVAGPAPQGRLLRRLPIISSLYGRILMLLFMLRVGLFLRRIDPDVIQMDPGVLHAQWVLRLLKPAHSTLILDIRHINVGIRQDLIGRFKERRQVRKLGFLVRLFDFTFFCHARTAQLVAGDQWQKTAAVVPVGIDEQFRRLPPKAAGKQDTQPVTFVYVGGLTRFRELENILYAAQMTTRQTRQFKITLVGPDKADGYYHQLVRTLHLEDVVEIHPPVPNEAVPALMAGFDVGLAYTPDRGTWDYQPTIKIIEYRALGLPILSFDVATHREWVEHGVNGLLLTHSIESLSAGMARYITDRAFLQMCTQNAQQMRMGNTVADVCRMYDAVYGRLRQQPPLQHAKRNGRSKLTI